MCCRIPARNSRKQSAPSTAEVEPLSAALQELASLMAERDELCTALANEGKGEGLARILRTGGDPAAAIAEALAHLQASADKIT